jgi:hypothetical protein
MIQKLFLFKIYSWMKLIKNGIYRKLAAARHMIDYDKEIAAGIYVYALEELGKLLVLKKSKQKGTNMR